MLLPLKQVDTAEYNPFEYVKTNVLGTQNITEVSLENNLKKVISLSTDKSVSPINLYGATKLCSDKIIFCHLITLRKKKIVYSL